MDMIVTKRCTNADNLNLDHKLYILDRDLQWSPYNLRIAHIIQSKAEYNSIVKMIKSQRPGIRDYIHFVLLRPLVRHKMTRRIEDYEAYKNIDIDGLLDHPLYK